MGTNDEAISTVRESGRCDEANGQDVPFEARAEEETLEKDAAGSIAATRVRELEQELAVERAARRRQAALAAVASHLRELRSRRERERPVPERTPIDAPTREQVLFDAAEDTEWAARAAGMEHVSHVFHGDWHGIRAAAAYLPGSKVAIPASRPLGAAEQRAVLERLSSTAATTVALHGFSEGAVELLRIIRKAFGSAIRICAVYHGSTAQFFSELERRAFFELVDLKRRRVLDAVGSVKPDMHLVSDLVHPVLLLNVPPTVSPARRASAHTGAVFVPIPIEWRKNFYTNLFAAEASQRVRRIYYTAKPPRDVTFSKGASVARPQRRQLFDLLGRVDLVLNATLSECQPMTALEALACGVPAVTGPLSLGALDEHPYQLLAQVAATDTIGPVRYAIDRLLEVAEREPRELTDMLADYEARLRLEALSRALDFYAP